MKNYHLVILKRFYLDMILSGRKTVESRFLKTRRHFFDRLGAGDILFLKESSGPVCGKAKVTAVKRFENLQPKHIEKIKSTYNRAICGTEEYWKSSINSIYGILVWLTDIERIEPIYIRKSDWRSWVVLTTRENFGLI
jgi:ASC-1-like (ASCH) protein